MIFKYFHARMALGALLVLAAMALLPESLWAHVKWFSHFSYADKPLGLEEALTPTFFALAVLSVVSIGILAGLDSKLQATAWFQKMDAKLGSYSKHSETVIRVGAGVVLLLSWQSDAMLVPELNILAEWIGWYQFILAFLLLFKKTTPVAGLGLALLYVFGIVEFGMLHMLDYPLYLGAGYYLFAVRSNVDFLRRATLPVLYFTLGFSLCWVALEKIFYPQWGLYVLQHQPQLSLGLDMDFFLLASAFVEFTLGYLVIIGLMERPLALLITMVFFTTTLTFGKVEVIGHTLVHAILVVLLIHGPGSEAPAPYSLFEKLPARIAMASGLFVVLLPLMLVPYANSAWAAYQENSHHEHMQKHSVDMKGENAASLHVNLVHDNMSGHNLEIVTDNFNFAPDKAGLEHVHGEGHAHLYINNVKTARIYHSWYHLPQLRPGKYEITVTLNANDHRVYTVDGEPIKFTHNIEIE